MLIFFKRLPVAISLCALLFASSVSANRTELYQLSFPNVDQQQVHLSDYKGKVVLLNFWATWCPPCIKEMPSMQRLRSQLQGQPFEIIAINAGEDATTVSSFLMELNTELTFPILLDNKGQSFRELGIRGLPMNLLYDQDGNLVQTIMGGREWDEPHHIKQIQQLIK